MKIPQYIWVTIFCVGFLVFFARSITNYYGDIFLAFPIVKEQAHLGLYSPYDLLVSSGMSGPFHIYKLVSVLYKVKLPISVDAVWYLMNISIQCLIFVLLWHIGKTITKRADVASISCMLIALSHPFCGTLNWSLLPPQALVTSVFALPLNYLALYYLIKDTYVPAILAAVLAANIHPLGYVMVGMILFYICIYSRLKVRSKIYLILLGVIGSLPNVIYTFQSTYSNIKPIGEEIYKQFYLFSHHAFVEIHYQEWYAWFFLQLGGSIFFLRYIDKHISKKIRYIYGFCLGAIFLYVVNLYICKYFGLMQLFLFRSTLFIKPIVVVITSVGILCFISRRYAKHVVASIAIGIIFLCSYLIHNVALAETFLIVVYGYIISTDKKSHHISTTISQITYGFCTIQLIAFFGSIFTGPIFIIVDQILLIVRIFIGIIFCVYALYSQHDFHIQQFKNTKMDSIPFRFIVISFVVGMCVVQGSKVLRFHDIFYILPEVNLQKYINFSKPEKPDDLDLVNWIQKSTKEGTLFIVPPYSKNANTFFAQFRVAAERGEYVIVNDINQLAYDTSVYLTAGKRLAKLNVILSGQQQFDVKGYNFLTRDQLIALYDNEHADYAVFEKSEFQRTDLNHALVYENASYVVFALDRIYNRTLP